MGSSFLRSQCVGLGTWLRTSKGPGAQPSQPTAGGYDNHRGGRREGPEIRGVG